MGAAAEGHASCGDAVRVAVAAIARDGYSVVRLGASASVKDMERVAMEAMQVDISSVSGYNGKGGVVRKTIGDTGFVDSSAGAPPEMRIQFHNELAYAMEFPKYVTFAMVTQASEDGTTTLADNFAVQKRLSEDLLRKMRTLGVQYVRYLHDESESSAPDFYSSWQGAFQTVDIDQAMRKGNSAEASSVMTKHPDGRRLVHTLWCPVFIDHPTLGELFFNSILNRHSSGWPYGVIPYDCIWGDGSEMSEGELADIRQAYDECTIFVRLDPGDVLVVDNLRVVHGRTPYKGNRQLGLLLSDTIPRAACSPPPEFTSLLPLPTARAELSAPHA